MRQFFYIAIFIAICVAGIALAFVLLGLTGCEVPQSAWNVHRTADVVRDTEQGACFFDGFDVICLIPGPQGEPGKDGKDGKSVVGPQGEPGKDGKSIVGPQGEPGKDGKDGSLLITRRYVISKPEIAAPPSIIDITVELPVESDPPASEPPSEMNALQPDPPPKPTRVTCGGDTCHVEKRDVGYVVVTKNLSSGDVGDDWILDEAGYQRWLTFLESLVSEE